MKLPSIVLGAGGHGRVLLSILRSSGWDVIGFTDSDNRILGASVDGLSVIGSDEIIDAILPSQVALVNGIGSTSSTEKRKLIYLKFMSKGYRFESVIHSSVISDGSVVLGYGVQIMAGAILQPGVKIGENSIINTGAIIDHDCSIGRHVHVGPGVILSGNVTVHDGCHIGTSACVIQGLTLGRGSLIGAGAVVVKNVPEHSKVAGVPARSMVKQ